MGLTGRLFDPAGWDWGTVPDWLVLVTAVAGAVLAVRQLRKSAEANRDGWRIQQGVQLMQIDDKYETTLQESRKAIKRLQLECEALIAGGEPTPLRDLISHRLSAIFAERSGIGSTDPAVRETAQAATDRYFVLMQLPTYIETIGVLVDEEQVGEDTILKLYDAMIASVIGNIVTHIAERRVGNPDFLRYAEALAVKAQARIDRANAATP